MGNLAVVADGRGVGVRDGVAVRVGVRVVVGVDVTVAVGCTSVGVGVAVSVGVAVGVSVAVLVAVTVGVAGYAETPDGVRGEGVGEPQPTTHKSTTAVAPARSPHGTGEQRDMVHVV